MSIDIQKNLELIHQYFETTSEVEEVYDEPENIIIVECSMRHRYKVNYGKDNLITQINRKCPYCNGYKAKALREQSFNINSLSLESIMNTVKGLEDFNNYEIYDLEGNQLQYNEITYCSNKFVRFKLKEGCSNTLDIILEEKNVIVPFKEHFKWSLNYISVGRYSKKLRTKKSMYTLKNIPFIDTSFYDEIDKQEIIEKNPEYDYFYYSNEKNLFTKEFVWLEKQALDEKIFKNILSEPDYKKRMQLEGKTPVIIPVYKVIENKIKPNEYYEHKRKREEIKKLKEEAKLIEEQTRELKDRLSQIKDKIKELGGIYKDSQSQSLLEWCQQPENKEIGDIVINHYMKNKNKFKLDEIPYDCKEVIWLKGNHGTNFKTTPSCITGKRKILPKLPKGTSYPELFIFFYMRSLYINTIHRGKALGKVEYDITIPELKMCIEYNGAVYHKIKYDKTETDNNKVQLCKQYGVNFISVEDDGETEEPKINGHKISYKYRKDSKVLYNLCEFIRNNIIHTSKEACDIKEIEKSIDLYI